MGRLTATFVACLGACGSLRTSFTAEMGRGGRRVAQRAPTDSEGKIASTAGEVRAIFQKYAEPWLERLSSLAAAKDELILKKHWWWASAAYLVL